MARSRFAKPEFFDDPVLARCSHPARLLFIATWQVADRLGVFEWDEAKLRKYAFGYEDITAAQVTAMLGELLRHGFIKHGVFKDKLYGFVVNLAKHQKFHVAEKPRFDEVSAGTIWAASTASTLPAPCQHPTLTVSESLSLETENGDGERRMETDRVEQCQNPEVALTAPPSAPAVAKRKRRTPEQSARSIAINKRYRQRYQEQEGHPPTGMDQAANGIIARFSDKHAENAMAILDWFFDSPDPYFKRSGWVLQLLFDQAPRLWREVNDTRKAIENLAAPAQTRQLSLAANNALNHQEYLRRKEERDAAK